MIEQLLTQAWIWRRKKEDEKISLGYIAPGIFRLANGTDRYNYFKTLSACLRRFLIFNKIVTGKDVKSDGFINFTGKAPVAIGINVDFFSWPESAGVYPLTYTDVKRGMAEKGESFNCMCRFYKTDGTGPFYTVFHAAYLGAAATVVKGLTSEKIALLDDYNRQLQIAQSNFNSFSVYINKLKSKKMNPATFAKYEAAVNKRSAFQAQLLDFVKAKEIDINFKTVPNVGVLLVDDIIIISIVATMALIAFLASKQIDSNERIKTVNASYNFQQFIAEQNRQISLDETAGDLSKAQADELRSQNNQAAGAAQAVVTDVVKAATEESKDGIFDKIQKILLIGGALYIGSKFIKQR